MEYDRVQGWPGLYWINQTSGELTVSCQRYECNYSGVLTNTHAIVRALNWWNDLYNALGAL